MSKGEAERARGVRAGARDPEVAVRTDHAEEAHSAAQGCGNCADRWIILAGDIDAAEYSAICHGELW